jgi:hypothetical protein
VDITDQDTEVLLETTIDVPDDNSDSVAPDEFTDTTQLENLETITDIQDDILSEPNMIHW